MTPETDIPTPAVPEPAILTEAEAAQLARLSAPTLQRLAEDGRGPARSKLSRRLVIRIAPSTPKGRERRHGPAARRGRWVDDVRRVAAMLGELCKLAAALWALLREVT